MVQAPKSAGKAKVPARGAKNPIPKAEQELQTEAAIGTRLLETRRALSLSQKDMCGPAGIAANTYNQYERGVARPSLDNALRLCYAHRLSLDWIYRGDPASLRVQLLDAIIALRESKSGN